MPYKSKYKGKDGLLIPINLDDVFLLSILDSNILISATNISKQNAFPTKSINNFDSVLKFRENAVPLGSLHTISNNNSIQTRKIPLPIPTSKTAATANTLPIIKKVDIDTMLKLIEKSKTLNAAADLKDPV